MDLWLILTLIASVGATFSAFIDNFLTDVYFKGRTPQAQKCFYGPIYCVIAIVVFVIYLFSTPFEYIPFSNLLLLFLSGVISSIASIAYYLALKDEDTTGVAIFLQLSPIFYLLLGTVFLGERIHGIQLLAFLIILAAPLTIILSARKRGKKLEYRAVFFILIYIIVYSFSHILFVFAERGLNEQGFNLPIIVAVATLLFGKGLLDIILSLSIKKWRLRAKHIYKSSKKKVLVPVIANAGIWAVVDYFNRAALVLGQVAVVSAVYNTAELLETFVFGLILTLIWPKFGREKLNRRTIVAHLAAMILAMIGVFIVDHPELFGG